MKAMYNEPGNSVLDQLPCKVIHFLIKLHISLCVQHGYAGKMWLGLCLPYPETLFNIFSSFSFYIIMNLPVSAPAILTAQEFSLSTKPIYFLQPTLPLGPLTVAWNAIHILVRSGIKYSRT